MKNTNYFNYHDSIRNNFLLYYLLSKFNSLLTTLLFKIIDSFLESLKHPESKFFRKTNKIKVFVAFNN